MNMNIAYMILAHHQPAQLARLINRLDQPNAYFFVHMDKKSPIKHTVAAQLHAHNKIVVMSDNDVNWMGFTTIDAEIDLLKAATNAGVSFKYYVLLSGQDYPIKSNEYINEFFSKHSNDFMSYNKIEYLNQGFKDKHTLYHFRDIPYINPRNPKKIPALVYIYFGLHNKLSKYMPKRKFYNNMDTYFGSQWFALSHDTVTYMLQFIATNEGYMKSMRNTDGPDETFFQTILMNSERKTNVYDYNRFTEWLKTRNEGDIFVPRLSSLRYMDWSERAKTKPAVMDATYFDDLKNSDNLFARKFDEKESAQIMDMLDAQILGKK
jgi:hypothetical protein